MSRLDALLRITRFPLLPTALADSAAGYLIALEPGASPSPAVLALLAAASGSLYMGGMVLNDIADLDRDRALHPARPLPSGQLSLREALGLFLLLAGGGLAAAASAPDRAGTAALLLFLAIAAYDLGLKRFPAAGALGMGACRAFNLWMGMAAAHTDMSPAWVWGPPAALGLYVTLITVVSTFEEKHPGAARWVGILLRGIIPLDAAMVLLKGRPWTEAACILALLPLAIGLKRLLPRHE